MLQIKNLNKKFEKNQVIKNLCFEIRQNEKICLFAPSGSGKSTLIKLINNLIKSSSGEINNNFAIMTTVFQEANLLWYKTVRENIFFPFKIKKCKISPSILQKYEAWIDICNLKGKENLYPHEISGGMKQKVSLIRSFLIKPDFIILDEPFSSIDLNSKKTIIRFIKKHYNETSMLFVTHNLDEIPILAEKILIFRETKLSDFEEISFNNLNTEQIIEKILKKIY